MQELQKRGNRYVWNPVVGNEYYLGTHHFRSTKLDRSEEVRAIYFGTLDGERHFFRRVGESIHLYTGDATDPAMFYSDGCDGPEYGVHVVTRYREEVLPGTLRDHVALRLEAHEAWLKELERRTGRRCA